MSKKLLAGLLVFIMMFAFLATACGEENDNNVSKAASETSNPADTSKSDASEEVSTAFIEGLDPTGLNINGYTIKFLILAPGQLYDDEQIIGYTEENDEEAADAVVVAIAERNNKLQQEYGFTITSESVSGDDCYNRFVERVRSDNNAGTADYQVLVGGANFLAPLTAEGLCYDFYNLGDGSYLNLDAEWWDPVTQEDMSVANSLYMISGDILYTDDQYTRCLYFNKDLVKQYNLDNPFDLVKSGDWNIDNMYTMMKEVAHPGGDGVMNVEGDDYWGLVGVSFDTYMFIMGGGLAQVSKDDNDIPQFAMLNEQNVNNFLKVFDVVADKSVTCFIEDYFRWNDYDNNHKVSDHFYQNQALFYAEHIGLVNSEKLRNADISYGIVPMPKVADGQEDYASMVNPYHFGIMEIPISIDENEIPQITFCLEAMAHYNYDTITAIYYDLTLKLKRLVDDEDSPEMLDIIFRNRLVDISVIFNWGDCIQYYNQLRSAGNKSIQSHLQSKLGTFESDLNKTLDLFKSLQED